MINLCVLKDDILEQLFNFLNPILALSPESFAIVSEQLMAGIAAIVQNNWPLFAGERRQLLMNLLTRTSMLVPASKYSFVITKYVLAGLSEGSEPFLDTENFGDCVDLLISFASMSTGSRFSSVSARQPGSRSPARVDGGKPRPRSLSTAYVLNC